MIITVEGAIDTHVHSDPELFKRIGTAHEIAVRAAEAGMRGIVFKVHHESTVQRCRSINEHIPGFDAISGITMNQWIGGFNPEAVDAALRLGAKVVWMPTMHAEYHMATLGGRGTYGIKSMTVEGNQEGQGMVVWGSGPGKLKPELIAVMEHIRKSDAVLATAHISPEEILAVARQAREMGVKLLINHPFFFPRGVDISYYKQLVDLGAVLELCAVAVYPMALHQRCEMTIGLSKELIDAVGPKHCVLATDAGQPFNPWPHEALRVYAQLLYEVGVPEMQLRQMMVENPSALLGL